MHQSARTDPSGGRGATHVPTGTQGNGRLERGSGSSRSLGHTTPAAYRMRHIALEPEPAGSRHTFGFCKKRGLDVSNRDQAYERVLILRQKVQALLKDLKNFRSFKTGCKKRNLVVGIAIRNSVPTIKVRH